MAVVTVFQPTQSIRLMEVVKDNRRHIFACTDADSNELLTAIPAGMLPLATMTPADAR